MKKRFLVLTLLLVIAFASPAAIANAQDATAPSPSAFGTWSGSWEGMGASGGFELTLEQGANGATGRVSVTGEPTYKATLKTAAVDGKKITAKYDFPPDEQLEVSLDGTMDGDSITGTWVVRGKGDGGELASGSWSVKKK
jgi:hypothetical protein